MTPAERRAAWAAAVRHQRLLWQDAVAAEIPALARQRYQLLEELQRELARLTGDATTGAK
jgi:hypothetical protein